MNASTREPAAEPQLIRLEEADHERILAVWKEAGLSTVRPRGRDSRESFARQLASASSPLRPHRGRGAGGVVLVSQDGRKAGSTAWPSPRRTADGAWPRG